jgi:transcription factor IIIB subunit 2
MDPSLYISRFAALLEFKDETQKVATDAVRLVQRFKRDWMDTGRRPAGICGACLLLAARMNNFRRSMQEIVQVVKIADVTLKKRLEEFRQTASGDLSIQDFRTMWLEETANPPAYTNGLKPKKSKAKSKNRLKELRGVVSDEEERSELGMQDEKEDGESVPPSTPRGSTPGASPAPSSRSRKGKERAREESEQPIVFQSPRSPGSTYSRRSGTPNPDAVFQAATDFNAETSDNEDEDDDDQAPSSSRNAHLVARSTPVRSQSGSVSPPPCRLGFSRRTRTPSIQPAGSEKEDEEIDEEEDTFVDTAVADEVSTFLHTTEAEGLTSELNEADRQAAERRAMEIEGRELEGLDEDELDCFLLTEDEVKIKTRVWMEFNKDYLEKLARTFLSRHLVNFHVQEICLHPSSSNVVFPF